MNWSAVLSVVTAASTAVLVVITGLYAYFTYRILRANEGVVEQMRAQSEAASRPYIVVAPQVFPDDQIFYLRVANVGKTAAHALRLELDRPFFMFGAKDDDHDLQKRSAFRQQIEQFAPGAEMVFYLAQGFNMFADSTGKIMPQQFNVLASYQFSGKSVKEQHAIDLRPYNGAAVPHDPIVTKLGEIRDRLHK